MEKDNFLDTNVIFSYSNYHEQFKDDLPPIVGKCYNFISNKRGRFIVCFAALEELQEIIIKRARIHKIVLDKIQDPNIDFENNSFLSKRDIPRVKKIYEKFKGYKIEVVVNYFKLERRLSELVIQKFLENMTDERVVPIEQIETVIINEINDIITNRADCKILASALQIQKSRDLFIFVTADGKDLSPDIYNSLKEHFEINHKKEGHIFPELLNLMFTD